MTRRTEITDDRLHDQSFCIIVLNPHGLSLEHSFVYSKYNVDAQVEHFYTLGGPNISVDTSFSTLNSVYQKAKLS